MRLLVCLDCNSIEELQDYEGSPDEDVLLADLAGRHRFADDREHRGNLIQVPDEFWAREDARKEIIKQIKDGLGHKGLAELDPDFYDTKNTFMDDASRCFLRHNSPQDGCIDYKDHSKRLGGHMKGGQQRYLCEFCPVETVHVNRKKQDQGIWTP